MRPRANPPGEQRAWSPLPSLSQLSAPLNPGSWRQPLFEKRRQQQDGSFLDLNLLLISSCNFHLRWGSGSKPTSPLLTCIYITLSASWKLGQHAQTPFSFTLHLLLLFSKQLNTILLALMSRFDYLHSVCQPRALGGLGMWIQVEEKAWGDALLSWGTFTGVLPRWGEEMDTSAPCKHIPHPRTMKAPLRNRGIWCPSAKKKKKILILVRCRKSNGMLSQELHNREEDWSK